MGSRKAGSRTSALINMQNGREVSNQGCMPKFIAVSISSSRAIRTRLSAYDPRSVYWPVLQKSYGFFLILSDTSRLKF